MEFFFAVFFLLFYYIRPQDWVPGLAGVGLIKPIIAAWFFVLLTYRSRQSPLQGLLQTPHDAIILTYWIYVAMTATDSMDALKGFLPLVAFYALTVQSLTTWEHLLTYFKWWLVALLVLAVFAVMIPFGIDVTGGKLITEQMQGRLSLGTWLHNNPNALGHSVIVLIPAAYFLFFWRGSVTGRFILFPAIAGLAFWCVYLTESKGSFLVGGIMMVCLFVVGRPKFIQITAIVIGLTLGVGALSFLPRMSDMGNLRADEGVQGRLLAWEIARGVTKTQATGVGWNEFIALISWQEGKITIHGIPKATHSSYVKIAADLGPYGLFIYLAGLWCVAHTLLRFRPANDMEDRCRRMLWILLISNLVSGWMINREYHTEYFLLLASAAALHRLAKARDLPQTSKDEPDVLVDEPAAVYPDRGLLATLPSIPPMLPVSGDSTSFVEGLPSAKPFWNKFGIFDVAVCIALTWGTFWLWDYILANI